MDPKMGQAISFHAPHGGADFLALRKGRSGQREIVYDDGVSRRIVWQVEAAVPEGRLTDALRLAARSLRIVPALLDELKKRAIPVARVAG